MSGHTPGPWHYDGGAQIVEVKRPHMRVAFLPSDHREYAASPANGRLIAAAPDLLAALKSILIWHANWDVQFHEEDEWRGDLELAKSAIAKATGAA